MTLVTADHKIFIICATHAWWHTTHSEFKASMIYKASSWAAKSTERPYF